jgi:enoyl-CoA hydratase
VERSGEVAASRSRRRRALRNCRLADLARRRQYGANRTLTEQTQMMATMFDGITRHNPEGLWFRRHAQAHGFKSAIEWRDSGRPIPEGDEARALVQEIEAKQETQKTPED